MLETPGEVTNWLETCGHSNNCKDELIKKMKDFRRIAGITLFDNTRKQSIANHY